MDKKEVFTTRDIYLAATFITLKFFMENVDCQYEGAGGKMVAYFSFQSTPDLLETEKKYWQGLLAVEPRVFMTNMKSLKAQINGAFKAPR